MNIASSNNNQVELSDMLNNMWDPLSAKPRVEIPETPETRIDEEDEFVDNNNNNTTNQEVVEEEEKKIEDIPNTNNSSSFARRRQILLAADDVIASTAADRQQNVDPDLTNMYNNLRDYVTQVIQANQDAVAATLAAGGGDNGAGNGGALIPTRGLASFPRRVNVEFVTDVAGFKEFWKNLNPESKNANERFICISGTLLNYIDSDDEVKLLFKSYMARMHNVDLAPYIDYLKSGSTEPFAINKIPNPIYASIPDAIQRKNFTICRFVKVKKDLIECFIATFDTLCFKRDIVTGFDICDPQPEVTSLVKNRWFNNYQRPNEEADQQFTKGAITQEGMRNLYDMTSLQLKKQRILRGNEVEYINVPYTQLHEGLLKEDFNLVLQGNVTTPCRDTNCFPLFRMLLETFNDSQQQQQQQRPPLLEFAKMKSCRIMKNCRNTLSGCQGKRVHQGPAEVGRSFTQSLPAEVAVFCTKIAVTVKHNKIDLPRSDFLLDNGLQSFPFRQEVVYELIDRNSKQVKLLSSTPPHDCVRGSIVPNLFEPVLSLGWLMQSDPRVSASLIDDYFDNQCFLNVDPSLILHNLHPQDRFSVTFEWQGIEGQPCFVTPYLFASYLKSSLQLNYEKEVNYLVSKAANEGDNYAKHIIKQCFPDALKALELAQSSARNTFNGI